MITYRLQKGSPLTIAELDANFKSLEDDIESLKEQQINLTIEQTGNRLVFKNNGIPIGTVVLPQFKGE